MDQLEELHPVRYAQVPHEALDGLPDLNSIGMLSIMLRHQPNFPFTVDRVIKQKKAIPGPKLGETVAYGAMTTLIEHRWAARVKFRCAGGHMHTSVFRTAKQFTLDDYREICGRFVAGTEKILHCKGCSEDPKIPVRTTIRAGASLQWANDTSKNGTRIVELLSPGGPLSTATGSKIPRTGATSTDVPVPGFPGTGTPGPGASGTFKNNSGEQEGEEGDAHAGASPNVPSAGDEPVWGVAGGAGIVMPTLASANLIRDIAGRVLLPGEGLTAEEHQRLASLVEAVRPIVEAQKGLSWEEYEAWLHQGWVRPNGQRTFKVLSGALGWRLQPEQVKQYAWPWACERRGAQEASEARGERETPSGGNGSEIHATTCGRHGTRTLDGQCLRCEEENAAEDRRFAEASQPSNEGFEEYDEPTPEEIDPKLLEEIHSSFEKADQKPAAPGNPWGSLGAARAHTYAASMREELARQKAERKAQKKQGRGEAPLGEVLREAGWEKAPHDAAW